MQTIKKIIPFIANRYFIAILAFVVWMLFFDQRDFFTQIDRAAEKYARERYLLRREGEEVYLFEDTVATASGKK